MSDPVVTAVDALSAPFGQKIELQDVTMDNNVRLLRIRIREGSRFTVFDIDPATADHWSQAMGAWAAATGTLKDSR